MITSSLTGFGGSQAPALETSNISLTETLPKENKKSEIEKNITVEEYVRNYFSDIPIMVEIARCESRFRQHDKSGEVLRGKVNTLDRGVMQINEYYHNDEADKLGFNLLTIEGNTAYARYLYEKYGVKPWKSSGPCWKKTVAYAHYTELAMK